MTGQPWLATTLAVVMIATAGYCLTRLGLSWRRRRGTDRQVDAMHVLMGAVMAGMLLPRARLPWPGAWETVFGAAVVLLACRMAASLRDRAGSHQPGHDLQHLIACGAMLYMLAARGAARGAGDAMSAGLAAGASRTATVALAFAVALLASVVLAADRMASLPRVRLPSGATALLAVATAGVVTAGPPAAAGGAAAPGRRAGGQAELPAPLSPRLAASCEIAMGLTMGYVLITML